MAKTWFSRVRSSIT